jgi:deoxyribonuclease-1-like protein
MIAGPRLGRTASKEQYVIYYRPGAVSFVDSFTVPDPHRRFERPPLVARFVAGRFDFRLVVSHIRPDAAGKELGSLAELAREGDILLGDFNADCRYFNEDMARHPLKTARFHWVVGNEAQTAVKSGCTYDRMVLLNGTFSKEYVPNSAQVFRYDQAFGITDRELVERISDHYPVFATFRLKAADAACPRLKGVAQC